MNFKVIITDDFKHLLIKFLKKHKDISNAYYKTIRLLEINPYYPSLRLHKLSGKHKGLYSISITMHYRITLEFEIQDNVITLINIGGHEVYS